METFDKINNQLGKFLTKNKDKNEVKHLLKRSEEIFKKYGELDLRKIVESIKSDANVLLQFSDKKITSKDFEKAINPQNIDTIFNSDFFSKALKKFNESFIDNEHYNKFNNLKDPVGVGLARLGCRVGPTEVAPWWCVGAVIVIIIVIIILL